MEIGIGKKISIFFVSPAVPKNTLVQVKSDCSSESRLNKGYLFNRRDQICRSYPMLYSGKFQWDVAQLI